VKVNTDDILDYLRDYHAKRGYAPSVREVASHLGVGVSTAHRHLREMLKTEEIVAESGRSRTWRAVSR
jgi:DNA-binding IclR family transcriptional regulator